MLHALLLEHMKYELLGDSLACFIAVPFCGSKVFKLATATQRNHAALCIKALCDDISLSCPKLEVDYILECAAG